jgi:hypothetical protein
VEEYGTARQTTNDNVIRRMRFAYWINKATDTLRIFKTSCFCAAAMGRRKPLNVTFIRILPVLYEFWPYATICFHNLHPPNVY